MCLYTTRVPAAHCSSNFLTGVNVGAQNSDPSRAVPARPQSTGSVRRGSLWLGTGDIHLGNMEVGRPSSRWEKLIWEGMDEIQERPLPPAPCPLQSC